MSDRVCIDCGVEVSRHSKGRCRPCATRVNRADPVKEANRIAALRVKVKSPEHRALHRASRLKLMVDRADDPAWQETMRLNGVRLQAQYRASEEAQAANRASRPRVGQVLHEQRMAWCPVERRDEYQVMRRKVGAVEARRILEADMTPFERQLARVRGGATLTTKFTMRRPDHAFTLGGVAPEGM